jgi:hypothetical protein
LPQKPKVNFQTGADHWSWTSRKAEGLRSEATSIRQGSHKGALCLFGWHGLCLEPLAAGAGQNRKAEGLCLEAGGKRGTFFIKNVSIIFHKLFFLYNKSTYQ